MRDANLLHAAETAITSTAFSTNALQINKTGEQGIWLQFVVSRDGADSDEYLQIEIYGKDNDASWDETTDDLVGGAGILLDADVASAGAAVVRYALVQTKHTYIKARYVVGGTTPDYDIESWGVVSGPSRDHVA